MVPKILIEKTAAAIKELDSMANFDSTPVRHVLFTEKEFYALLGKEYEKRRSYGFALLAYSKGEDYNDIKHLFNKLSDRKEFLYDNIPGSKKEIENLVDDFNGIVNQYLRKRRLNDPKVDMIVSYALYKLDDYLDKNPGDKIKLEDIAEFSYTQFSMSKSMKEQSNECMCYHNQFENFEKKAKDRLLRCCPKILKEDYFSHKDGMWSVGHMVHNITNWFKACGIESNQDIINVYSFWESRKIIKKLTSFYTCKDKRAEIRPSDLRKLKKLSGLHIRENIAREKEREKRAKDREDRSV
jgi:hypothetical protein